MPNVEQNNFRTKFRGVSRTWLVAFVMALAFSMLGMMYVVSDLLPMLPPSILPEPWQRELAFDAVAIAALIFNGLILIGLLRLCVAYTRLLN